MRKVRNRIRVRQRSGYRRGCNGQVLHLWPPVQDPQEVFRAHRAGGFGQEGENIEEVTPIVQQKEPVNDPLAQLKRTLDQYIAASDYRALLTESKEALDTYPLQPYFYYAYGTALNNTGNANKGVEVLLSGLDYLLDDTALQNKMYKQLSEGYSKIGNAQKANEYLNKINSGL